MRLYSFVNFYLSSIQQGIQTGHLTDAMTVKYLINVKWPLPRADVYREWIQNHKTYITLNGGANEDIQTLNMRLGEIGVILELPFGYFREDENSLGGIMTCCGIVVPEHLYEAMNYRTFISKYPEQKNTRNIRYDKESIVIDTPIINHNEDAFFYVPTESDEFTFTTYVPDSYEWKLINIIKSCSLAR